MSDASVTPEPSMDEILQKIQRIIAEDEKPESAPAPNPPRSAEILTLTEAVGEGGTVRRLTPVETAPEPIPEPPPEPPRPQERRIEAVPPASEAPRPAVDRLMSDSTAGAAATAFAQLAAIQREKRRADECPMGLQARTLEDLVRELLRPMLQGWLDQKLPEILDRLVKAELAKALHEAGIE
jgi:cell pole-organizing protein PopZ